MTTMDVAQLPAQAAKDLQAGKPVKLAKPPIAPGVNVLRLASASAGASRRRAALSLLTALRRPKDAGNGKSGRTYLKELRASRHAR